MNLRLNSINNLLCISPCTYLMQPSLYNKWNEKLSKSYVEGTLFYALFTCTVSYLRLIPRWRNNDAGEQDKDLCAVYDK